LSANFHPYLKNVLFDDTDVYQDDILNRYKDPGAGAFSYHFGKKWYTTRDVQAGEELFDDYDESWFLNYEVRKIRLFNQVNLLLVTDVSNK
jgi:hypothetical protein